MYVDKLIVVVLVHVKIKSIVLIIQERGLAMEKFVNVLYQQRFKQTFYYVSTL
jgi:hypothetical protein